MAGPSGPVTSGGPPHVAASACGHRRRTAETGSFSCGHFWAGRAHNLTKLGPRLGAWTKSMLARARTHSGVRFAAGCWARARRRRAPPCPVLFVYDVSWLLSLCCYRAQFRGRCRVVATQGRRVWLWLLCRTNCDGFEGLAARRPAMTRPLIERRDMIAG